jgi:hypothetical protein
MDEKDAGKKATQTMVSRSNTSMNDPRLHPIGRALEQQALADKDKRQDNK